MPGDQEEQKKEGEDVMQSEKVFDISPDLNISPINEAQEEAPSGPIQMPESASTNKSQLQSEIESTLRANHIIKTPMPPQVKSATTGTVSNPVAQKPVDLASTQTSVPIPNPKNNFTLKDPETKKIGQAPSLPENVADKYRSPQISESANLKPIRTYESDVAEAMAHKRTSTASIAIAESKKAEQGETLGNKEAPNPAGKKVLMLVLSLVVALAGVGGGIYLFLKSPLAPAGKTQPEAPTITSIIPADQHAVIRITNDNRYSVESKIRSEISKNLPPNTIKEVIVAKTQGEKNVRISSQEMIKLMDIDAPDILTRSLSSSWMLGVLSDENSEKHVFVVVTTNFFQNTFAGMLQWEKVMPDDLKDYITSSGKGIANIADRVANDPRLVATINGTSTQSASSTASSTILSTASSTASSTSSNSLNSASTTSIAIENVLSPYAVIKGQFTDRLIKNKDVREFRTTENEVIFLYSFIDNTRLIVTGTEKALDDILVRLEKEAFIR